MRMMLRLVFQFLIRSGAILMLPVTLALELPGYQAGKSLLERNWPTTLEVVDSSATPIAIVTLVFGAVVSVRWGDILLGQPGRPWRSACSALLPAALVGAIAGTTHLAWSAFLIAGSAGDTAGRFQPAPVGVAALAIATSAIAGGLMGLVWHSWLLPVALGVSAYVTVVALFSGPYANLVNLGGVGSVLAGVRARPSVLTAQALLCLSVCLVAPVVASAARRGVSAGMMVLVLPILMAVLVVHQGPGRFGPAQLTWSCAGDDPAVCVADMPTKQGRSLSARVHVLEHRWRDLGGVTTASYAQRQDVDPRSSRTPLALWPGMDDQALAFSLVQAKFACTDSWSPEQVHVAEVLARQLASGAVPRFADDVTDLSCR